MDDGIHIPREVADAEGVPDELDAGIVGPYRFPDPRRRRIAGWIYLVAAVAVGVLALGNPVIWVGAGVLVVLAAWHLIASWPLTIEQEEALSRAATAVSFPVGHASAAVTFVGLRSRPRWHVVLYDSDDPPSRRALVEFDAVTGAPVGDVYEEAVPEVPR